MAHEESAFEAQSLLVARFGLEFDQKVEANLGISRRRYVEECRRREVEELARVMVSSWGARVVELRRMGVRLPVGSGTGGRQMQRRRERRQAEVARGQRAADR